MNLKNVTVVVTRYFGGIKLGAGGLIRAYSNSVTEGVEHIGVVKRVLQQELIFLIAGFYLIVVKTDCISKSIMSGVMMLFTYFLDKIICRCSKARLTARINFPCCL